MIEQIPLRHDDVLHLTGSNFDPHELHRAVAPLGLEAHITTLSALAEDEVKRLVLQHGISYVWRLVRLQEAVMPPTPDVPALFSALSRMLDDLAPTDDFIVIDRYLLPRGSDGDYGRMLGDLLEPVARRVKLLTVVTGSKHDAALRAQLLTRLTRAKPCKVQHRTSDRFHDRFWIADRSRGIFTGTSLNGLGRRYALVDVMDPTDVAEIVQALEVEQLVEQGLNRRRHR